MENVQTEGLTPSGAEKPYARLVGADGNIFGLISVANRALKKAGLHDDAKDMTNKVMESGSYHEALNMILSYVRDESEADKPGPDDDYTEEDEDEDR